MYRPYFESSARFLRQKGISAELYDGRPVSESELTMLSDTLGVAVPDELLGFLRELGDGFKFQWDLPSNGDLMSFGLSFLDDIIREREWIPQDLREVAANGPANVAEEAMRRLGWLPVMGVGDGGYEFCLDTSLHPAPVSYYVTYWKDCPETWKVITADSLPDLVRNWSRYCFSDPPVGGGHVSLTQIAEELDQNFDWAPSHFDPQFDRGTSDVDV